MRANVGKHTRVGRERGRDPPVSCTLIGSRLVPMNLSVPVSEYTNDERRGEAPDAAAIRDQLRGQRNLPRLAKASMTPESESTAARGERVAGASRGQQRRSDGSVTRRRRARPESTCPQLAFRSRASGLRSSTRHAQSGSLLSDRPAKVPDAASLPEAALLQGRRKVDPRPRKN